MRNPRKTVENRPRRRQFRDSPDDLAHERIGCMIMLVAAGLIAAPIVYYIGKLFFW